MMKPGKGFKACPGASLRYPTKPGDPVPLTATTALHILDTWGWYSMSTMV